MSLIMLAFQVVNLTNHLIALIHPAAFGELLDAKWGVDFAKVISIENVVDDGIFKVSVNIPRWAYHQSAFGYR